VRPFHKNTPRRDNHEEDSACSPLNRNSFISPKKELSFGKEVLSSTPVVKTPLLKHVYDTPYQQSELLDDDLTKAEFSNLFSNKSNHMSNL
jgi:hypothetical protein